MQTSAQFWKVSPKFVFKIMFAKEMKGKCEKAFMLPPHKQDMKAVPPEGVSLLVKLLLIKDAVLQYTVHHRNTCHTDHTYSTHIAHLDGIVKLTYTV